MTLPLEAADQCGVDLGAEQHDVQTAGEDMPDAYRYTPVDDCDADVTIMGIYDPDVKEARFQEVWGMLFGFSSAVMGFNRWPRFLVAMVRRLLAVLWSMYFDDGTLVTVQPVERHIVVCEGSVRIQVGEARCCGTASHHHCD